VTTMPKIPDTPGTPTDVELPAISIQNLSKSFGTNEVLKDISLDVATGEVVCVIGPSGSGKSTLLHCMAGLDQVDSGTVLLGEVDLTRLDERRRTHLRRDQVGFIFQTYNLLPTLTAGENITLPLAIAGRAPDRGWISRVVDAVGLGDRLGHRPRELSGGQQQRLAAARALAGRPAVVFADEPTGNLDSRSGAELLGFLRRSVDEFGQTIVMVTHDPVAAGHADEAVFLADGRIVDRLAGPTAAAVLDRMKTLGGP
jgi:putative ABC transport system ATP-binding protein